MSDKTSFHRPANAEWTDTEMRDFWDFEKMPHLSRIEDSESSDTPEGAGEVLTRNRNALIQKIQDGQPDAKVENPGKKAPSKKGSSAKAKKRFDKKAKKMGLNHPGEKNWPGFLGRMQEAALRGNVHWRKTIGARLDVEPWPENKPFFYMPNRDRRILDEQELSMEDIRLSLYELELRAKAASWYAYHVGLAIDEETDCD